MKTASSPTAPKVNVGSICVFRAPYANGGWNPNWKAKLKMPARSPEIRTTGFEICGDCLAVPRGVSVTEERPDCGCREGADKFAAAWLKAERKEWAGARLRSFSEPLRVRATAAVVTIGKVKATHLANVPERKRTNAVDCWRDLYNIVEQATGLDAENQPVTILTKSLGLRWMRLRQVYNAEMEAETRRTWEQLRNALDDARTAFPGLVTDLPLDGNGTINSMYGHARSLFGRKSRSFYLEGLELPEVNGFCELSLLPASKGFTGVPAGVLAEIDAMVAKWQGADDVQTRELWLAYELLLTTGMRPIELRCARRSWLVRDDACEHRETPGWVIVVKNRPEEDFYVKAREKETVRYCPIDDAAVLWMILGRDGLLVAPTLHATGRKDLTERLLSQKLRAHLKDDKEFPNPVYTLRKLFTSAVYRVHGREAAAARAGHAGSQVTEAHYATGSAGVVPTVTRGQILGGH